MAVHYARDYKILGQTTKNLTTTAGTVNCGTVRVVDAQASLDGNSSYEVALKASMSGAATASKNNCNAVLSDLGAESFVRPGGYGTWYLAYRMYNGATAARGTATDKLVATKRG